MSYSYRQGGYEFEDPQFVEEFKKAVKLGKIGRAIDLELVRQHVKYPQYLSAHNPEDEGKYSTISNPDGAKNDKGHLGDPSFKNLFYNKDAKTFDLSPNFGTEIDGIQLSKLDDAGKNDLALYLATRGLAIFRDQDFRDQGPEFARNFGKYFGPLHIHPVASSVVDYPEFLVTFRKEGGPERYEGEFAHKTNLVTWHSDISFEEYPASFSFFVALEVPESGGDTVFADTREAYRRLSPEFQKVLEGLTAIHTSYQFNKYSELTGTVVKIKKDYVTEHPLVRTHPVTGEKSLFFSRGFIKSIKGFKPAESSAILNFLDAHLNSTDLQVRAQHRGTLRATVIAWDNRIALHTAVADFLRQKTGHRHHFRITVLGERPYLDKDEENGQNEQNGQNGHSNGHSNDQSNGH